jgi:hypothetical protein
LPSIHSNGDGCPNGDLDKVVRNLNFNGRRVCMVCGGSFEVSCVRQIVTRSIGGGYVKVPRGADDGADAMDSRAASGRADRNGLGRVHSRMQLVWLRWRGIVATVPSGRGSRYSASTLSCYGSTRVTMYRGLTIRQAACKPCSAMFTDHLRWRSLSTIVVINRGSEEGITTA